MVPGTLQEQVLLFLWSGGLGSGGFASLAHRLVVLFGYLHAAVFNTVVPVDLRFLRRFSPCSLFLTFVAKWYV